MRFLQSTLLNKVLLIVICLALIPTLVSAQQANAGTNEKESGAVRVYVLIDETGKVIEAKALDGPASKRAAAEKAALQSSFNPTIINGQPVKITGTITYDLSALDKKPTVRLADKSPVKAPAKTLAQQETPPKPSAPREVQFPKPVEMTLRNGLRVIVIERHEVPLVTANVVIKSGGETDPSNLAGLAQMTANLLTKGTTTRSATQIAQQIEQLGGSIYSSARWDASVAGVDVMASRLPQALEILSDVVRNPSFKDEEIERLRTQTLDQVRVALTEPGSLARFVAARAVFGDAPYAHTLSGTPETIARIKRDDIARLHAEFYRPNNAVLVIGGDIKATDAFKIAENYFGKWQAKPTPPPGLVATKTVSAMNDKLRVIVIDKPDAGQAAVVVARRGISRKDGNYFRGIVSNTVLGGGYSARLNEEVRIKRGLSYGAGSQLDARLNTGPFIASAQTKNESAAEVASLLIGELDKLATAPIPNDEMTPRKATLIGNFARNLETANGLVAQVASLALYGLSLDEINHYISNVQAVTENDVHKFASDKLSAKTANIIIVGNGKMFLDDLRKRFQNVEVIPIAQLDLNNANLRRANASNITGK